MLTEIIQYSALQFSTFTHIHPSQVKNLSDQLILVDKKDNEIGSLSKLNSHLKSQNNQHPHRAFSVFLFNNKNELLLQQRSSKKVTFPLLWSNTCCSHPLNIPDERIKKNNEGILNAVVRRMKVELGIITNPSQFMLYDKILYRADSDEKYEEYELDYLFLMKSSKWKYKERIVKNSMNTDEVENVKYISYNALKEDLVKNKKIYTPWFKFIMEKRGKEMFDLIKNGYKKYKYNGEIISFL